VRFTRSPADVERADLVVIPGTKATVEDLERLRAGGLDRALEARAAEGGPILGICGGYQLLGRSIEDRVESRRGQVPGLALLPVRTSFAPDKLLRRRTGRSDWLGTGASGYEIRHGRVSAAAEPLLTADDGETDGCRNGPVAGFSWHGALEHDEFRHALLGWVARARGLTFVPGDTPFRAMREARLDVLGELVTANLDTDRLAALIESGPPAELPTIATEVRECFAL
jgi:adenosylcobyric acid synthase